MFLDCHIEGGELSVSLLPRECGIWLSLGGFHERGQDWEQNQKIYNCHVLLNSKGEPAEPLSLPLSSLFYLSSTPTFSIFSQALGLRGFMLLFLAYKSLFGRRARLDFQRVCTILPLGSVVASYRKTHLCDVEIPGQGPMRESNYTMPGQALELPVKTPAGKVGA